MSQQGTYYVGLDCLALPQNLSGAGYYIFYLARELLKNIREFPIAILCKPEHSRLFDPYIQSEDKIVPIPLKNRMHRLYFYDFALQEILIKQNISVFHATHYICPPRNKSYKVVTTFHDMGFFLHPNYYPFSKRFYFNQRMRTFLNRSDKIVAISKTTQNAIQKLFPEHSNKISLIYPGANHLLYEDIEQNYSELEPPYIVAVNSFEKRKNIPFVIRLFTKLKKNYRINHRLLIIGHPSNGFKQVLKAKTQSEFSDDIHILISLSTESLNYLYQNSQIFVNASSYEGFGFTPLEAINYDLPTFLFKNQVVDEIFGDHPYVFADWNVNLWASRIRDELDNNFPNKITRDKIQHLTWKDTANRFIELFRQLIFSKEPLFASQ